MTTADRYFALLDAPANTAFLRVIAKGQDTTRTQAEFARAVMQAAAVLADAGAKRGDTVPIFLHQGAWLLPSFFAAQWLGAIPSYMPPVSPRQDLAAYIGAHISLLAHLAPPVIVAEPDVADLFRAHTAARLITPSALAEGAAAQAPPRTRVESDDIALLQHSSGTTGLKKGVALTYRAILNQIDAYSAALGLAGNETVVTWLPVYHDMGLIACTVLPFVKALPIIALDPFEWMVQPHRLLDLAGSVDRALVWLPNFAFHHLVTRASRLAPETRLDRIVALIDCSEPCKPETFDAFIAAFAARGITPAQLRTCYAMAENVFAVTQSPAGAVRRAEMAPEAAARARTFLSCGAPVPGVSVEIRDANGAVLGENQVGEIFISGACLFDGYAGQPDLTAERLTAGWYASRDRGFLRDGELYICGRTEDLIIVAGRNLYAHDVEAIVSDCAGIKPGRAVALGVDNPDTGTQDLVVLAERAPALPRPAAEIERELRKTLSEIILAAPREIVIVEPDTLIKTTSGKMSRAENLRRYLAGELKSWSAHDRAS